jgi:hypothetical protein
MTVWPMETVSAGDMTAPSEGRRTRLGEVIYGAMFEVQIDLRYGGAEKAEYIADAVRRALEEAEPGDHPDSAVELGELIDRLTLDVLGRTAERDRARSVAVALECEGEDECAGAAEDGEPR